MAKEKYTRQQVRIPKSAMTVITKAAKESGLSVPKYLKLASNRLMRELACEGSVRTRAVSIGYEVEEYDNHEDKVKHICGNKSAFAAIAALLYARKVKLDYDLF